MPGTLCTRYGFIFDEENRGWFPLGSAPAHDLLSMEHAEAVKRAFENLGQYKGTARAASLPEIISRKKDRKQNPTMNGTLSESLICALAVIVYVEQCVFSKL